MQEKKTFVLESERVKKQEYRKKKRKIDEMHECIVIEETSKSIRTSWMITEISKNVSNNFIQV